MDIKKTAIVSEEEPLTRVVSQLMKNNPAVIVVDKNGRYLGIIDDRNIRFGLKNVDNVKAGTVATKAPNIKNSEIERIEENLQRFLAGSFRALPVLDANGKPLGVATRADLLRELLNAGKIPLISCSSIMASPVYTIESSETVKTLKRLMKELKANRFIVMEREKILGVVSSHDLLMFMEKPIERQRMQLVPQIKSAEDESQIKQIARQDLIFLNQNENLNDAVQKLAEKDTSYAVCIDSRENPVGVITAVDIFKLVLRITAPRPTIVISGLSHEDMYYYDDIKSQVEKDIGKISKLAHVGNANLHIKKGKATYLIKLNIEIEGHAKHFKAEGHGINGTMKQLGNDMVTIVKKLKALGNNKNNSERGVEDET